MLGVGKKPRSTLNPWRIFSFLQTQELLRPMIYNPNLQSCLRNTRGHWSHKGLGKGMFQIPHSHLLCLKCQHRRCWHHSRQAHLYSLQTEGSVLAWLKASSACKQRAACRHRSRQAHLYSLQTEDSVLGAYFLYPKTACSL